MILFGCISKEKCPEGINLLPMYGMEPKCKGQLSADADFLSLCDSLYKDRKIAAQYYVGKGWEYFYKKDYETSMKRCNQAWLLDSFNYETYWGFGNILGMNSKFKESLPLLEKSILLNPENPKIYQSIAISYAQLFYETKDGELLHKSIDNLNSSLQLDSTSVSTLAQLTAAYSYFMQKDSARKYLSLTDKIDPNAVNPEVRKILTED